MPKKKNYIPKIITNPPSLDLLLSAFDCVDRSIAIFDGAGFIIDINTHALRTYGIKDKVAFMKFRPNIFDSPSFSSSFDPNQTYSTDVVSKVLFNYDKFSDSFPGISFRKGRALHYLRIHPIYDGMGTIQYILVFSTDMTSMKSERATTHQLRDNLSYMMNVEGISTWTYDIKSGKRILDAGAHLFPEYENMEDFMDCLHYSDKRILTNIISLIQLGDRNEGQVVIRVVDKTLADDYIYLETLCTPQVSDGKVIGVFFMTKDVTIREKKQLELAIKDKRLMTEKASLYKANTLLHSIIDRMPCLFFAKDINKDFRYSMANSIFCNYINKGIEQVIGHNDEELFPSGGYASDYRASDMMAIEHGPYKCWEESEIGGVKKKWSTIKYCIKTNSNHRYLVCISLDVTDLSDAYDKMKEAQVKAESSSKMMTVFLKNVCSELVTPLNSVLGFSDLLISPASEQERELYHTQINQSGKALKLIIDDIIDLSNLESGNKYIIKETFDLTGFMLGLRTEYEPLINSGVEFRIEVPLERFMVSMDIYHLKKIIHRGVMNSILFTYQGHISIGYEFVGVDRVGIFVEDTGIGLSEEEMATVTTNHKNINNFTESMATSLSICKIIAKAIGGEIDFSSSKGEVSKIMISLPIK